MGHFSQTCHPDSTILWHETAKSQHRFDWPFLRIESCKCLLHCHVSYVLATVLVYLLLDGSRPRQCHPNKQCLEKRKKEEKILQRGVGGTDEIMSWTEETSSRDRKRKWLGCDDCRTCFTSKILLCQIQLRCVSSIIVGIVDLHSYLLTLFKFISVLETCDPFGV